MPFLVTIQLIKKQKDFFYRNSLKEVTKVHYSLNKCRLGLAAFILLFFFIHITNEVLAQNTVEPIKIGFLIRDKGDSALIRMAQLAIDDANSNGGYRSKPFSLVTKSCDGPWGVGSKQSVDLVHEDLVPIIVGAVDGRNAHLAEQVTAKAHVVFLDALASDPTLAGAYVPWYFRMVPDDKQQSAALVQEIYLVKKAKNVAVIAMDNYDGKISAQAFQSAAKAKGFPEPAMFTGDQQNDLLKKSWDAIVIAGTGSLLNINTAQTGKAALYCYTNHFSFAKTNYPEAMKVRFPVSSAFNAKAGEALLSRYKLIYNESCPHSLIYLYDAIMLAVEAIRKHGPDVEALRVNFRSIRYQGITGSAVFDAIGNRKLEIVISGP